MQRQDKPQGTQRITLLDTTAASDNLFPEVEDGLGAIATVKLCRERRDTGPDFFEHCTSGDIVESVLEVEEECPKIAG